MPWPDHVPQDESGDSPRMRYSRRRAPGPGIPTTLLLRRMLLLGTDASRRATGSRQCVVAYRSRSSAYTRYRNRSYAPSRPTERDSPCRILRRRPCHTSRSPRRWRADGCHRSIDIRHTLRGNARADRESRPGAPCTSFRLQETLRPAIRIRHARNVRQAARTARRWVKGEIVHAVPSIR